jgi:hypothetical protein
LDDAPNSNPDTLTQALRSILEVCARTGLAPAPARSVAAQLEPFESRPLLVIVGDCHSTRRAAADWAGGTDLVGATDSPADSWAARLAPPRLTAGAAPADFDVLLAGLPASALDLQGAIAGLHGLRPVIALAAREHDEPWPADLAAALDQADLTLLARPAGAAPEPARPRNPLVFELALPSTNETPAARALSAGAAIAAAGQLGALLRAAGRTRDLIVAGVHELDERVTVLKADQNAAATAAGPMHAFQIEALAAAKRLNGLAASGRVWAERPTGDLAAGIATFIGGLQPRDIVETRVGNAQELTLSAEADARLRRETAQRLRTTFGERLDAFATQLQKEQSALQEGWSVRPTVKPPAASRALAAIDGWLPTAPASAAYVKPSLFSGMVGARSAAALLTLLLSFLSTRLNLDPALVKVLAPTALAVALILAIGPIPSTLRAQRAARAKAMARLSALSVQQYCDAAGRAWSREIQPSIEDAIGDFRLSADAAAKTVQSRQDAAVARRREALAQDLQARLKAAAAWRKIAPDIQNRLIALVAEANRELDRQRGLILAAAEA